MGLEKNETHAFEEPIPGVFVKNDETGCIRMSTILKRLRAQGTPASLNAVAKIEADAKIAGVCPVHGVLPDPILGLLEERFFFACPHCSGADIFAAWEEEGIRETRS